MAELSVAEPGGAAVEVTAAGLPDGWVAVQHASGRVLYLHKASRVCSWSKPYCVGTSTTVRKHRVPVGAIPCLEKWLFGEERSALAESWHRTAGVHKGLLYKLEAPMLSEYFRLRWEDDDDVTSAPPMEGPRHPAKRQKLEKQTQLASHPEDITVNIPEHFQKGKKIPSVWIANFSTKSAVQLLHEFCQNYLKVTPEFDKEDESQSLYVCCVVIEGIKYERGRGSTKRLAKQDAAEKTLKLFFPELQKKDDAASNSVVDCFSTVSLDSPAAWSLLQKAGLRSPWETLQLCHHRNRGKLDEEMVFGLAPSNDGGGKHGAMSYTLSCGQQFSVSGSCSGKSEGQQLAAQAALKLLHPYISEWAALLTLYAHFDASEEATDKAAEAQESCAGDEHSDTQLLLVLKQRMKQL